MIQRRFYVENWCACLSTRINTSRNKLCPSHILFTSLLVFFSFCYSVLCFTVLYYTVRYIYIYTLINEATFIVYGSECMYLYDICLCIVNGSAVRVFQMSLYVTFSFIYNFFFVVSTSNQLFLSNLLK